jgi:alpha-D-ribose 1-methylphosphonate 5-triphosphate synthase subunit PhnG
MVQGRMGGDGDPFNVGEMTVTRCAVRMAADGRVGHAYVSGRRPAHAEMAAVFDALLQDKKRRAVLESKVIAPLEALQRKRRLAASRKTAATRVEFFTLVRGD